jgi:hypothetical protein
MNKMPIITAMVIVLVLWLGTWGFGTYFFDNWQERGQFGDLFGSVNALFSGLAFLGLIYTIRLQGQELSLQREELKLQREEMAASRAELEHQVRAIIGQIKVTAEMARVEAIKMDAESKIPGARAEYIRAINETALRITNIANELET